MTSLLFWPKCNEAQTPYSECKRKPVCSKMMLMIYVSFLGIVCAVLIAVLNCYCIFLFKSQKTQKPDGMTQFYYRFHLDVVIGTMMGLYIGHTLTYYVWPQFFEATRIMVLWFGLFTANLHMARIIFQLLITCDRAVAAFFPVKYHIYHSRVPALPLFFLSIFGGLFQNVAYFFICNNRISVPENCLSLACATNYCFKTYWSKFQSIFTFVIILLAIAFYIRLHFWSKSSNSLAQAYRLAMIDAVTIFVCQFVQPFCLTLWPESEFFQLSNVGPVLLFGKLVGNTIESVLMLKLLKAKFEVQQPKVLSVRGQSQGSQTAKY